MGDKIRKSVPKVSSEKILSDRSMKQESIQVRPISLLPTPMGCGMFLSDGEKVVLLYIDPSIGASMNEVLSEEESERPQTHDFFHSFIEAVGGEMIGAYIVREEDEVFYAMATFQVENEVSEKKIVQLDCRPSDCISMALRADIPIFFLKEVWEKQPDMSDLLENLNHQIDQIDE